MKAHRGHRNVTRVVTALALVASTVTVAQAVGAEPEARTDALDWKACGEQGQRLQCATLEVPLEYGDAGKDGGTVRLALTRLPASGGQNKGSVVINAGNQAGGGGDFVRGFGPALASVNRDHDVIGLDTRGVGGSRPQVRCTSYEENRELEAPLSADQTTADRPTRISEAQQLADYCERRSGALLPHLSSTTSARDLDKVRQALGEDKLRYIGVSGGSVLGQNYLQMFPDRTGPMVLDSPFDAPSYINDAFGFDIEQMQATERTLGTFFDWCKDTPGKCSYGDGQPRAAFEKLMAKTRQNRLDHPGRWDIVTDGSLVDYVSGQLLFPQGWPKLAEQLKAMSGQPLPKMPLPTGDDRTFAEYYSQSCLDREFPQRLGAFDRQLRKAKAAAPYLGGRYGYAEFKCRQWPAEAAERSDGPWHNPGRAPVLVLTADDDPQAPHRGALRAAHRLGAGIVDLRASGHIQIGRAPCVDKAVRTFLDSGDAPDHTTCPVALPGR